MASLVLQFTALKCSPLSSSFLSQPSLFTQQRHNQRRASTSIVNSVALANAQNKERVKLKKLFEEAYERCRTAPMEGVSFTLEDFTAALDKYDFDSEVGSKVKGTVFYTDNNGAVVDITAKSSAYLPLQEASIRKVKHVEEAGIVAGLREEFLIIGENQADDSLILSLRSIQYDLAWERCRQLQAEDAAVKGKIVGVNKGGVVAEVEGLRGFVPLSQLSTTKIIPSKYIMKTDDDAFVRIDEVLSSLKEKPSKGLLYGLISSKSSPQAASGTSVRRNGHMIHTHYGHMVLAMLSLET